MAKVKITWHFHFPNDVATKPTHQTFVLDDNKSWKGKLIRGYDVAEMIAQDIWETESIAVRKLHIISPATFAGVYDVKPEFAPSFTATLASCTTTPSGKS